MRRLFQCVVAALLVMLMAPALAGRYDTDKKGADHPMISRYAGSLLYMHGGENYGAARVFGAENGKPVEQQAEGRIASRVYWAPKGKSALEVFRNYQAALRDAGFSTVYQCELALCEQHGVQGKMVRWLERIEWDGGGKSDPYIIRMFEYKPGFHYLHARKEGATGKVDIQVALNMGDVADHKLQGRVQQFVQVIEAGELAQGNVTVDARAIGDALRSEGKIALYGIEFDTGLAQIRPASDATLAQMAKALASEPGMNVFIVGHTDNVGTVEGNAALSRKRAQAVVEALVSRYKIAAARLQAQGVANFAPVGSNATESGRARNRRVEMVVR
jgi:OOP family OmpA-OmpF porin